MTITRHHRLSGLEDAVCIFDLNLQSSKLTRLRQIKPLGSSGARASIGIGSLPRADISKHTLGSQSTSTDSTIWHPFARPFIWEGSSKEALQQGSWPQKLPPSWKVILLSDGSVTRHLQIMTDLKVRVDCFQMETLPPDASDLPASVGLIKGPLLQRQVFLGTPLDSEASSNSKLPPGTPLVYAASWWNDEQARIKLEQEDLPIWTSLQGTELRRDLQMVYYGNSDYLEEKFGTDGPFWGRDYIFYHDGGKPLTVIYEVFSTRLKEYLGPISPELL